MCSVVVVVMMLMTVVAVLAVVGEEVVLVMIVTTMTIIYAEHYDYPKVDSKLKALLQEPMLDPANARAKMQAWSSDMTPNTLTLVYHRRATSHSKLNFSLHTLHVAVTHVPCLSSHVSHLTYRISHHTSLVTRHTSHVIRYTLRV
jgi:hypothetical protein